MHGPVEPPIRRTALNSLHSKNNKTIKDGGISPWHWDHNCRYRPHRMIWTQGLRRTTKRNWLDQSYWEDCLVWSGLVWSQIHQKDQGFNNVGPGLLFSWSAMQRICNALQCCRVLSRCKFWCFLSKAWLTESWSIYFHWMESKKRWSADWLHGDLRRWDSCSNETCNVTNPLILPFYTHASLHIVALPGTQLSGARAQFSWN